MNTDNTSRQWVRACTVVYAIMLLLTFATWTAGKLGLQGLPVALLVLFMALLKGQLIGDWFMDLRGRAGIWRWIVVLWLLIPGTLVSWAFWMANKG